MSEGNKNFFEVPARKKPELKTLIQTPVLAYKTIMLAGVCLSALLLTNGSALLFDTSIWLMCLLNSVVYYSLFSVVHDGIHRSICQNTKLNDAIAQLGTTVLLPYVKLSLLRWAHMEHHRFTNEDGRDPDQFFHGSAWTLPLRWILVDVHYAIRALKNDNPGVKKMVRQSWPAMFLGLAGILITILSGYGIELLLLWFIPSRVALLLTGFTFFWLPHAHAFGQDSEVELRQSHNPTAASVIRIGHDWLLSPLLQGQNYHLIHHLWPTTPFYNNKKVWELLGTELSECDLAVAHGFQVMPELKHSTSAAKEASHG